MNFYRRSLIAIVIVSLVMTMSAAPVASASDGFWIRKGVTTGGPRKTIRRTVIKSAPKKSTAKKNTKIDAGADVDPNTDTNVATPTASPATQPATAASSTRSGSATRTGSATRSDSPTTTQPASSIDTDAPAETGSSTKSSTTPDGSAIKTIADSNPSGDVPTSYQGVTFSDPVQQKWRVGVVLVTGREAVGDVFTYIPIPKAWPEQSVRVFDEDIPVEFAVQKIDELDGLDRLILRGRVIPAKRKIVALQTFMVTTSRVNAPEDTTVFELPDAKDKLAKKFLASSSEISFRNNTLRKQAQSLFEPEGTAWQRVERVYDWVRDNIDQGGGNPYGTLNTFAKKTGHPEDVVGLFVAMCRANKVPARMVFVDGSQYAEFMLVDPAGGVHWFPADVVGIRAFGKIVEPKVILQKGDNIRVPGVKGKKKFVAAYGEVKSKTAPKLMQFVREPLSE